MKKIMNRITKKLTDKFQPFAGLIVFKSDSDYYIELRKINKGVFEAAQPLPESFISNIIKKMNASESDFYQSGGIMPNNILYLNQQPGKIEMIWYRKPGKSMMHFTKELNITSGQSNLPGLIFHIKNGNLNVFAYKGETPKEKSVLFRGPFFNVDQSGYVCLGNAKVKKNQNKTFQSLISEMELMFFGSEFSHITGVNPIKSNLSGLYRRLIGTDEIFPESELKSMKINLVTYISNLTK